MAVCSGVGWARETGLMAHNRQKPRGRMAALIMGSVAFREHQRGSGCGVCSGCRCRCRCGIKCNSPFLLVRFGGQYNLVLGNSNDIVFLAIEGDRRRAYAPSRPAFVLWRILKIGGVPVDALKRSFLGDDATFA